MPKITHPVIALTPNKIREIIRALQFEMTPAEVRELRFFLEQSLVDLEHICDRLDNDDLS